MLQDAEDGRRKNRQLIKNMFKFIRPNSSLLKQRIFMKQYIGNDSNSGRQKTLKKKHIHIVKIDRMSPEFLWQYDECLCENWFAAHR